MSRLNVFSNMKDRISSSFSRASTAKAEDAFRSSMADGDGRRVSMPRGSASEMVADGDAARSGTFLARSQLSRLSSSGSVGGSDGGEHKSEVAAARRMSTTYSRDIDPDFHDESPPASAPRVPAEAADGDAPLPPSPPRSAMKSADSPRTRVKKGISFEGDNRSNSPPPGGAGAGARAATSSTASSSDLGGKCPHPLLLTYFLYHRPSPPRPFESPHLPSTSSCRQGAAGAAPCARPPP